MASLAASLRALAAQGRARPTAVALGAGAAGVALVLWLRWRRRGRGGAALAAAQSASLLGAGEAARKKKKKASVDREFLRRLKAIVRIVLPSVRSKEFGLLALHTGFLVARTFISIYVARLDGFIVQSIVDRNTHQFVMRMVRWLLIAIPACYVNSMIRYLESKLGLAFRDRLVDHVYRLYMGSETYYLVDNVDGRMKNPDQCLTEDVARFCSQLAHIYSQISKPIFDVVLMFGQLFLLAKERSGSGMQLHYPWMLGTAIVLLTGFVLRRATPPFGRLAEEEGRLHGVLRAVHARLITHSEEIAFYGGHKVEETALRAAYNNLVRHTNSIYRQRIFYTMLEQFLMKYVWGAGGLVMIAIPTLMRSSEKDAAEKAMDSSQMADGVSQRTQGFVTAKGLLISAADALERLLSSWKEVTELAGYTARVSDMMETFSDVQRGRFVKTVGAEADRLLQQRGEVVDDQPLIRLEDVPVMTPNGDVLVRRLSFEIRPGMHLLITGPNGCGKSSLFRMIGGLWQVHGGRLFKPSKGAMFYIPQRPYLTNGSLRDQFIYPDTLEDMRRKGRADADLEALVQVVDLGGVVKREGGWNSVAEWRDVLSGGEKQRVAMARLFYHHPQFAILDECTSAVSIDVEGQMYLYAKQIGITLITVTHRPTLWKYHTHLLQFDGQGNYTFSELNATARLSLQEERDRLRAQLAGVPKLQERLKELDGLLGE